MTEETYKETCFCCGRRFQHSNGDYGQYIGAWKVSQCRHCHGRAWGDVPPICSAKLLAHLKSLGIEAKPDANGVLRWPT